MNHGYVNPRGHGLDRHMRLLLCMHDIELRLPKPGTCQWKFKDMFPLQYYFNLFHTDGGKSVKLLGGMTIGAFELLFVGFLQVDFQAGPARDSACFTGSMSPGFLLQSCHHFRNVNPSGRGHSHRHRCGHRRGPQFHSQRGSKRWIWRWRTLADVARCYIALTGR